MTIRLEVDTRDVVENLNGIISSLDELLKPNILNEISKAAFSITGKRFMIDIDNHARLNPKAMHHIYEWGGIGDPNSRLFVLERMLMLNGTLVINTEFLPSKKPVPINKKLLMRGSTGKIVSKKSIFSNKVKVMENGNPISFNTKRILTIVGNNGIAFISPGTQINILHPGGLKTKNSFANYLLEWYTKKAHIVLDSSGLYENLTNSVAGVLNQDRPNPAKIELAVTKVVNKIGLEVIIK